MRSPAEDCRQANSGNLLFQIPVDEGFTKQREKIARAQTSVVLTVVQKNIHFRSHFCTYHCRLAHLYMRDQSPLLLFFDWAVLTKEESHRHAEHLWLSRKCFRLNHLRPTPPVPICHPCPTPAVETDTLWHCLEPSLIAASVNTRQSFISSADNMKSYQTMETVPEVEAAFRDDRHDDVPPARTRLGKRFGVVLLAAGAVCLLIALCNAVMSATTQHYARIPLELEGSSWYSRQREEETDHNAMEDGCEATIMIIRHCEKGNLKKHCDYVGLERSVYLASLFGEDEERWPAPSYIFAEGPDGRTHPDKRNYREIETVGPLSVKTGVKVDASFNTDTSKDLVNHLAKKLKKGELCGKLALIVWKHSDIGYLAHKLGCGQAQGCPLDYHGKTFDLIWQLRFVYNFDAYGNTTQFSKYKHHNKWQIYGSVQAENFDPLSFSKEQGVSSYCWIICCYENTKHIACLTHLAIFSAGLSPRWKKGPSSLVCQSKNCAR